MNIFNASLGSGKNYVKPILSLPIVNGDFNGANIDFWDTQNLSVAFEIYDGENAVKLESTGAYSLLKQSVATTIGGKYKVTALMNDVNIGGEVGLVVYDTDLQTTTVGSAQDPLILNAHTLNASPDWQVAEVIFTATSNMCTVCCRELSNNFFYLNEVI